MYGFYNQVNVLGLFDNYHIVLNCIVNFVHSPLNSCLYVHWILDFKIFLFIFYYD